MMIEVQRKAFSAHTLKQHLCVSLMCAEDYKSRLEPDGGPVSHTVGGFCGKKTRHFFSQLGNLPLHYLEIGTLHGAAALSLLYGSRGVHATMVDDWSFPEANPDPETLKRNIMRYTPTDSSATLVEGDCWEVSLEGMGPFDVLYYDADHSREATARAFTHFLPVMSEQFLIIIDDFNWGEVDFGVTMGCFEARQQGVELYCERSVGLGKENDAEGFWNGMWAGVFRKGTLDDGTG